MKGDRHWRIWSGQEQSTGIRIIGKRFTTDSTSGKQRNRIATVHSVVFCGKVCGKTNQPTDKNNGKGYEQEITCLYADSAHPHTPQTHIMKTRKRKKKIIEKADNT